MSHFQQWSNPRRGISRAGRASTPALLLGLAVVLAFWAGVTWRSWRSSPAASTTERAILYYVDPMNPTHTSAEPGTAPCGMKMEPVYASDRGMQSDPRIAATLPGAIRVSAEKQQLIGVRVEEVVLSSGSRTLRLPGKVAPDEARFFRVVAPVDGWVRDVGPFVTGNLVRRHDVLATFYNREFLTAQQTYFYALNTLDRFKDNDSAEQVKLTQAQKRAAEDNLEALGMTREQMNEIARTRQTARDIELRAPAMGLMVAREAYQGLRFERGAELFRLVGLERVWVLVDLPIEEAETFSPGACARVSRFEQDTPMEGKVSDSIPQFDSSTRTLKLRLEIDNPHLTLRPEMFVRVDLTVDYEPTIAIPADAILDHGLRKTVFVEREAGVFEPRTVETGWQSASRRQIVRGLMTGERIVVAGNFLLDSESKMRWAATTAKRTELDPVCGMDVDIRDAAAAARIAVQDGSNVFFCSDACKAAFLQAPAKYLKISSVGKLSSQVRPLTSGMRAKLDRPAQGMESRFKEPESLEAQEEAPETNNIADKSLRSPIAPGENSPTGSFYLLPRRRMARQNAGLPPRMAPSDPVFSPTNTPASRD